MRQGFRIRQLTSGTRELSGPAGLLLALGVVGGHRSCACIAAESLRHQGHASCYLYLSSVCVSARGVTAEATCHAMDPLKLKMQANLMPRDQHRHTWPIRQNHTRCAREKSECHDATHMNGRTTRAHLPPPQMPSRLSARCCIGDLI